MELRESCDTEEAMADEEEHIRAPERDDAVGCFVQHTGESRKEMLV